MMTYGPCLGTKSEQEQNEHEQPKRRKGPGDCLTPAATLGLLLAVAVLGGLRWAVWG